MQLRAPEKDGESIVVPPLHEIGRLIRDNQAAFAPFIELRSQARADVLRLASIYHAENGEPIPGRQSDVWFVSGHQPELFHPGVWVKNFALQGLARSHDAVAVNLIVDNDTAKSSSLRLPNGERIAFDRYSGEQPWEERQVLEPHTFATFPERLAQAMARWHIAPLGVKLWQHLPKTGTLGERLAAGRRALERNWDCHNLEVPLGRVCDTPSFAEFVRLIFRDAPRFVTAYNAAVADYRRRHRIKSRNHPVPDLTREGDWWEMPLWSWSAGASQRERVFVRDSVLRPTGMKLRSRALLTTLFARLCLADVFIHGLGGGLYDRLTDDIICRFFVVQPPRFVILSATCLLPLPNSGATKQQRRDMHRRLRDLEYQPERFLNGAMAELMENRRRVLAETPSRQMFARQRELLARLNAPLEAQREQTRRELVELDSRLASDAVRRRRDYSLCLFPEEKLKPFLTAWLQRPDFARIMPSPS
ncbi:MAG: hypothetical protein EBV06_12910 [Planctomycetia bacterium]|nr:hypothetical protein [Planctomycetia bacterium]